MQSRLGPTITAVTVRILRDEAKVRTNGSLALCGIVFAGDFTVQDYFVGKEEGTGS